MREPVRRAPSTEHCHVISNIIIHFGRRFDVKTVTLDPIYLTEHDPSVTRFTFGGDTSFGRRFLDPKADEFFPKEEIFCAPDAIIDCNNPLPGSMTLFTWIKPYFAHSDYPVSWTIHFYTIDELSLPSLTHYFRLLIWKAW